MSRSASERGVHRRGDTKAAQRRPCRWSVAEDQDDERRDSMCLHVGDIPQGGSSSHKHGSARMVTSAQDWTGRARVRDAVDGEGESPMADADRMT